MIYLQSLVAKWLGERDGVVIVDGSGFPKQGKHSIGVAYQYCGHLGKIANCQEGVFLAYTSRRGYSFLDERLYLPQDWFATDHSQQRKACGLPERIHFQTEGELAGMLRELWACDSFNGSLMTKVTGKIRRFRRNRGDAQMVHGWGAQRPRLVAHLVEEPGRGLMGRPRLHRRVRRSASAPEELRVLVVNLPRTAWHRHLIHEGSKGPLKADFALLRVTPIHDRLPAIRQWLLCRRSLGSQPELKFYLSNALCPTQN
jgi:hypothetical protein